PRASHERVEAMSTSPKNAGDDPHTSEGKDADQGVAKMVENWNWERLNANALSPPVRPGDGIEERERFTRPPDNDEAWSETSDRRRSTSWLFRPIGKTGQERLRRTCDFLVAVLVPLSIPFIANEIARWRQ